MLFDETLDHAVQVRVARAEAACEPVPAASRNLLAVSKYVELPSLAGCTKHFNIQTLLDAGRETRDLSLVVLSRRAVDDFYFHSSSILLAAASRLSNPVLPPVHLALVSRILTENCAAGRLYGSCPA